MEGVVSIAVGLVIVLEVVVGWLDALVLQLVDGVHVHGDGVLQAACLGLAGKLGGCFGLWKNRGSLRDLLKR